MSNAVSHTLVGNVAMWLHIAGMEKLKCNESDADDVGSDSSSVFAK